MLLSVLKVNNRHHISHINISICLSKIFLVQNRKHRPPLLLAMFLILFKLAKTGLFPLAQPYCWHFLVKETSSAFLYNFPPSGFVWLFPHDIVPCISPIYISCISYKLVISKSLDWIRLKYLNKMPYLWYRMPPIASFQEMCNVRLSYCLWC